MSTYHEPVMVDEVMELLLEGDGGVYLDGTVGGGGHAAALLRRCDRCFVVAVDRDPEALAAARERLEPFADRVRFVEGRFDLVLQHGAVERESLAGALLDLGVSSHQIDEPRRGFSFRRGAPLDMRMDARAGAPEELRHDGARTAAELLNEGSEERLAGVFRDFGEERSARRLAREVVKRRRTEPFDTSDQVVAALATVLGRSPSNQEKARIFQALRMEVNDELEALERALPALREALGAGGVVVVVAYHSLEDRAVKRAFRSWSRDCICPPELPVCRCRGRALGTTLTRKPLRPAEAEVERNPRARSARLRAWRKAS